MTEGQEDIKPSEKEYYKVRLACPIEHWFFGSTPSNNMDVADALGKVKAGQKDLLKELLQPDYLRTSEKSIDEVNALRKKESTYLQGSLNIFLEHAVQISFEGKLLYLELPEVDKETGLVKPEWKVWVLDGKTPDKDTVSELTLFEIYTPYFELSPTAQEGYRLLTLKDSDLN